MKKRAKPKPRTKTKPRKRLVPGEILLAAAPIVANAGRESISLAVRNRGDRPIQVGSHYHFFETNGALEFERARAYGMRLDIPAGTAVRFEPGQKKTIALVPYGGKREVWGFQARVDGPLEGGAR